MSKGMNKNTLIGVIKLIEGIGPKIDWNTKTNKQLVDAVLAIKNADEAKRFLRDLMTESEIEEFANRLETARLLVGDVQYNTIIQNTSLSSTTIARISKWLKGSLGGYRLILARLSNHHHNRPKLGKGLSLS